MLQDEANRIYTKSEGSNRRARTIVRALIVEENEEDASQLAQELQQNGVEIAWRQCRSEAEFLALLKPQPDLILTDYALPGFGAQRILQLLQERNLTIPTLVVAEGLSDQAALMILKLGATDYVPWSQLSELSERVVRALQGLRKIAYFSMEIALESGIPTYSGGLGVLAGDTLRAAADMQTPMVAVTLLHRNGYFQQELDESGWQHEGPMRWDPAEHLQQTSAQAHMMISGRRVDLRIWKYEIRGVSGYIVPVYLIDTDLPENTLWDRGLTDVLYGGDWTYRLGQEMALGVGGIRALRALGYDQIERFHMNEGHAGLMTLALLEESAERAGRSKINLDDLAAVRQRCIFTTHTPVPAGHDQYPLNVVSQVLWGRNDPRDAFLGDVAERVLGRRQTDNGEHKSGGLNAEINMSYLALNMSRYINGVAKKHGEISRMMFAGYHIDAITNGVHAGTWASPQMQQLFDRYIPDWRYDNFSLRNAEGIPCEEIWEAHRQAKEELVEYVQHRLGEGLDPEAYTIGLARRATAYKRLDLIFSDAERLREISRNCGRIQIVCSGKAHPSDNEGKRLIQRIHEMKAKLQDDVRIVFLENYDMDVARRLVAGVDVWLNTPQPPLEASGTSGMKAALNGVPSFSILDGWWIEGWIEGVTGWSIESNGISSGSLEMASEDGMRSALSLYEKLEGKILPLFYSDRRHYIRVMQHAIAINGSFFNTQRMLQQYVVRAYFR